MSSTSHASVASAFTAPFRWIADWLRKPPITDPVDQRNAPMVQVLMLMLGVLPCLSWGYRALLSDAAWREGEFSSMVVSLALASCALIGFVLVRRGLFKSAVRLLLAAIAGSMMVAAVRNGTQMGQHELPMLAVWLVLAGLVLGRPALWLMYGWIVLTNAVGTWVDIERGNPRFSALDMGMGAVVTAVIFLFVAIVIDRSVSALRESLRVANERGNALSERNLRLQQEIERREALQTQLVHAQKLEAVGRLSSGIAHDFNHLLSLILGHAGRGLKQAESEAAQTAFKNIDSAVRRAAAVTRKLLNFSRLEQAQLELFDAAAALRETESMLRQLLGPSIRITLQMPESPCPVFFDRGQFELIVLNLAANAGHAMDGNGELQIALQPSAAGGIELGVRDSGHGMSAEVQAHIFKPFYTTKPAGEGVGLGLSVVRDLLLDCGGNIEVESAPGQGSHFRLRFASAEQTHAALEQAGADA